jgi:hypothetical protein
VTANKGTSNKITVKIFMIVFVSYRSFARPSREYIEKKCILCIILVNGKSVSVAYLPPILDHIASHTMRE